MTKKLIEYMIGTLVDKPQLVKIEEFEAQGKHIVEIRVTPHDLPKLIGKEGRVFRTLRSIVHILSVSRPTDIVVDILKD